ncbi:hypothetical protein [Paenibacillus naphthalenovorans]|uniref:hypothetical protein n=1 Tax=Paenibacillus naphthalenovorans TaxID=162209 RepID=UPI003D2CE4F0
MLRSNLPVKQNPLFKPLLLPSVYRRKPQEQSAHDKAIEEIALYYHNQGKYVRADHINWLHGKPEKTGFHIPDVTVYDYTGISIFEVETLDSALTPHSISQIRSFCNEGKTTLLLVLPKVTIYNQRYVESEVNEIFSRFNKLRLNNLIIKTL